MATHQTGPTLLVVQARLASHRLPAKALLPLGGMPVAVLSALRAANTGREVLIATSSCSWDDAIEEVAEAARIQCFRGQHIDVLDRFTEASRHLPEDGVVVRLTADNVFPDGQFIDELLSLYRTTGADYVATQPPHDSLPYGMSAEAFSVTRLREAAVRATTAPDREHVTPWIRRNCTTRFYRSSNAHPQWSRLRCTLDTFEDYTLLLEVFAGLADPVKTPWRELVAKLLDRNTCMNLPRCAYRVQSSGEVHSVLTVGTAQLGLPYGIANSDGIPTEDETEKMLSCASAAGITEIDTARAYGISEERIGKLLPRKSAGGMRVTTKLDVLREVPDGASPEAVRDAVERSVFRSLHALRSRQLDTLLLHRWAHHDAWCGAAWLHLLALQREGFVLRLGASVDTPAEAVAALADPNIVQLQCPVNILDHRWREEKFLRAIDRRPDVVVHARSSLLQGVLTLDPEKWPRIPGVDAFGVCRMLDQLVVAFKRSNRIDLCLAFVRALPWVTSVVVGTENVSQLRSNLLLLSTPTLLKSEISRVVRELPQFPEAFLNPAHWRSFA